MRNIFCFILFYWITYGSFFIEQHSIERKRKTRNVVHLLFPYKTKESFGAS